MRILFALSNQLILSSTLICIKSLIFDNVTEIGEPSDVHCSKNISKFSTVLILKLFRLDIISSLITRLISIYNEQLLSNYTILKNDQKLRPNLSVCYLIKEFNYLCTLFKSFSPIFYLQFMLINHTKS